MIKFTKIAKYSLVPEQGDTYDYLSDLALGHSNPPSLEPSSYAPSARVLIHSTLLRAVHCIKKTPNITLVPCDALREVRFDMAVCAPREVWEHEKSMAVRRGFKQAFLNDALVTPRAALFEEILLSLRTVFQAYEHSESVEILSHSFRMKLLETYIRTEGRICEDPSLIHTYMPDNVHTYPFLGGFEVEPEDIKKLLI